MRKKKGIFIVIDGSDGSGKATQTVLLAKRLKEERRKVKTIDFPHYEKNLFGSLIGECLAGKYGDFIALDPHIASVLYAADRFESSGDIRKWLDQGYVVISDRYVSANQIHQGGKIQDSRKRKKFMEWLEKMEFGVFNLPKPDLILYLDVPIDVSQKLLNKNSSSMKQKKKHVRGGKDLADKNLNYLEKSRKSALSIVKKHNNWVKIQCVKSGKLMSIEDIHTLVFNEIQTLL